MKETSVFCPKAKRKLFPFPSPPNTRCATRIFFSASDQSKRLEEKPNAELQVCRTQEARITQVSASCCYQEKFEERKVMHKSHHVYFLIKTLFKQIKIDNKSNKCCLVPYAITHAALQ